MKVVVTRSWGREKYGSYRVSFEDEVNVDEHAQIPSEALRAAADNLAYECLLAYDRYVKIQEEWAQGGGDFRTAKETVEAEETRGGGADKPESGTASVAPRETPRGGSEPTGPGTVTELQLAELYELTARSTSASELVRKALTHLKAEKVENISTDAAAALIGKLKRGSEEPKEEGQATL